MSTSILAQEVLYNAKAFGQTTPVYSDSIRFDKCQGNATVILIVTATSTSSLAITQQCSIDNVNWYDPVDSGGTATGALVSSQVVTTGKYVSYSPVLTLFIRFKAIQTNNVTGTITMTLIFREEG